MFLSPFFSTLVRYSSVLWRPARMVFFATNATRETMLNEFSPKEGTAFRNRADVKSKLEHDKTSATDRVKKIEASTLRRLGAWSVSWAGKMPAQKAGIDRTLSTMADQKVRDAESELRTSGVSAYNRIIDRANDSKRSLVVLTTKSDLCTEVITALDAEVTVLEGLRSHYLEMAELLGGKAEKIDMPELKRIQVRRDMVDEIKQTTEERRSTLESNPARERVQKVDAQLRQFLLQADPAFAADLEKALLNNAADNGAGLDSTIRKLLRDKKIDQSEADLFLSMAKELRGAGKWFNNRLSKTDVANYYREKLHEKGDLNPQEKKDGTAFTDDERLTERLGTFKKCDVGQSVTIDIEGVPTEFALMTKRENQMILINKKDRTYAVLDLQKDGAEYKLTFPKASGGFTHARLMAPAVRGATKKLLPQYNNPTNIYLEATEAPRPKNKVFDFSPPSGWLPPGATVSVCGTFNFWNSKADVMTETPPAGSGVFKVTKPFAPGTVIEYKFCAVDASGAEKWFPDPGANFTETI